MLENKALIQLCMNVNESVCVRTCFTHGLINMLLPHLKEHSHKQAIKTPPPLDSCCPSGPCGIVGSLWSSYETTHVFHSLCVKDAPLISPFSSQGLRFLEFSSLLNEFLPMAVFHLFGVRSVLLAATLTGSEKQIVSSLWHCKSPAGKKQKQAGNHGKWLTGAWRALSSRSMLPLEFLDSGF